MKEGGKREGKERQKECGGRKEGERGKKEEEKKREDIRRGLGTHYSAHACRTGNRIHQAHDKSYQTSHAIMLQAIKD